MPELKKWFLKETIEGPLYANGEVYGHYRLEDGEFIHTSYIVNYYDLENGEYVLETYSGSLYLLQKNEMQPELSEHTKRLLENAEWKNADGIKEKIALANHEFAMKREAREQVIELREKVHVGMFQDSVLITDWENGTVDFRFFPNFRMEPYHWSDGLKKIHIHNIGAKEEDKSNH